MKIKVGKRFNFYILIDQAVSNNRRVFFGDTIVLLGLILLGLGVAGIDIRHPRIQIGRGWGLIELEISLLVVYLAGYGR